MTGNAVEHTRRDHGTLRVTAFRDGQASETEAIDDLPSLLSGEDACVWIDLTDPGPDAVSQIAKALGLHPLIAEDIIESNERAKVEHVGEVIHFVLYAVHRQEDGTGVHSDELDFVLGPHFLLSVHPDSWDPRAAHQLKMGPEAMMRKGPDFLLWALADSVVDGYFPIFDQLGDEVDDLQDQVIANPVASTLERVFALKRELIRLRHVLAPTREIFNQLTSREYDLISEPHVLYFRDIYDHLVRLTDDFDSDRDLIAGTIEVYLSTINNNLSAIMKKLTGVTVVVAGIGALAGIFGMSEAGPALSGGEGLGFWLITALSVALGAAAVVVLRRIDWF
jgi:magnesium transporter